MSDVSRYGSVTYGQTANELVGDHAGNMTAHALAGEPAVLWSTAPYGGPPRPNVVPPPQRADGREGFCLGLDDTCKLRRAADSPYCAKHRGGD